MCCDTPWRNSIVAVALVEIANFVIEKREALLKETQAAVIKNAAAGEGGSFVEKEKKEGLFAPVQAFFDEHRLLAVLANLTVYSVIAGAIFCAIEVRRASSRGSTVCAQALLYIS